MKKIIMFLEDNAYLNRHTVEKLNEKLQAEGYEVKGFHRIEQANEYIKDVLSGKLKDIQICCIVTDLNMDDSWLGEHKTETDGGRFSGWVWLKYNVFDKLRDVHMIIYSGYTEDLEAYLKGNSELRKKKILTVSKGGDNNQGLVGLYKAIKDKLGL